MSDKSVKTVTTFGDLAPAGVDGKVWIQTLKQQLLSSKNGEPTNEELLYFARVCQASGLDPARREIYGIYRNVKQKDGTYKPKLSIQTGIDGLRVTAEKTGKFGGSKEPEFEYDPDIKITVNYAGDIRLVPNKCRVTVLKLVGNRVIETTRSAKWQEYYPGDAQGNMWKKLPETMLAKVAEAQALRAAFPNCGQLYLDEEMQQASVDPDTGTDMDVIKAQVKEAKTLDDLMELLNGLPVETQKQLVGLIETKSKELQEDV